MIILDTNVVSELWRPHPSAAVETWVESLDWNQTYISTVTLGELYDGAYRLPDGRRKSTLLALIVDLEALSFKGRILPFDLTSSRHYGSIKAVRRSEGKPIGTPDAIIAATAKSFRFQLATRNTRDFDGLGLDLVNPFGES
jgi:toxin FitB